MKYRTLGVLLIIMLIVNCATSIIYFEKGSASVTPKFYVDDDFTSSTPGWQITHFDKIQDAIDAAVAGDRIIVYDGTYTENLVINKKLEIFGEDRDITIINGGGSGDVVTLLTEYVNISHFTIKNSGSNDYNSVIKIKAGHSIITDNIISNGKHGVSSHSHSNNQIYDNIIKTNTGNAIQLNQSIQNDITYNDLSSNSNGIFLYSSSDNTIQNNDIKSNSANGIFLNETSNNNEISTII